VRLEAKTARPQNKNPDLEAWFFLGLKIKARANINSQLKNTLLQRGTHAVLKAMTNNCPMS